MRNRLSQSLRVRATSAFTLTFALALCSLLAVAAPAAAQITINLNHPPEDFVEGDPLPIAVEVASPSEVTSVTATVGTQTIGLTFRSSPPSGWFGFLPLDGLRAGRSSSSSPRRTPQRRPRR